jgi:hypothetical protein
MGMKLKEGVLLLAIASMMALTGCGGGGTGGSGATGGTGTMNVRLADAPDPTITSIDITFTKLEAHIGSSWEEIPLADETVNLLDLTDEDMLLGSAVLPAGSYNQIRLFPSLVTVTDADGTHTVNIGSAANTGIKVNINADLPANAVQTLLLDFNVDKSLIKQGNGQYRLQPVLKGVIKTLSGTITGTATDGTNPLLNAHVTAIYEAGDSYPIGTEVNTSSSMSDGGFTIWALLPGTYTLNFSWTSADGAVTKTAQVTGVVVTANQETTIGSITLN